MKTIIIILIISLFSCKVSQPLQKTGSYVVSEAVKADSATMVKLQNVKGLYTFLSDTIKVGDTLRINVIRIHNKRKNAN